MDIRQSSSLIISVFLIFYLLYLGKAFFIPFSIAVVAWYLTIALTSAYRSFSIGNFRFGRSGATALSILSLIIIIAAIASLLNANISRIIELAPSYEHKFKSLSIEVLDLAGFDTSLGLRQVLDSFDVSGLVIKATKLFTATAGSLIMIIVYTLFLLLEYRNIGKKLKLVFSDHAAHARFYRILFNIDQDILTYLKIKTIAGFSAAVISYFILSFVGVDLAGFWALLTFILSYIPTVGPIVAVFFPALVSLIQFDSVIPLLVVSSSLSLLQLSIGNILEPRYMGKSLNLSPLVIIISLSFWGAIWGVVGMFLSVPIMVITNIILAKFERTRPIAIMLSARGKV